MAAFSAPPIGCLLMAAGNASRFGENKLTARFDGQSLFSRALEAIPAGVFVRVTVVSAHGRWRTVPESYTWSPTSRCCRPERYDALWTHGRNTRTALPPQRTTESAATRACFRRSFSRNCVHWRQTAAAHPSFGGTKMRCCSSRQESANCSTATQSRRWKF